MAVYQAVSSDSEVLGKNILTYISAMGAFQAIGKRILSQHGIDENPLPEKWYNHQEFLNSIKEIASKTGVNTIRSIGMRVAEQAAFPPQVHSFEDALFSLNHSYQASHRGDNLSSKEVSKIKENQYEVIITTPYPCDFDIGYLRGLANRFLENFVLTVTHDPQKPCRNTGGDSCTYVVSW